MKLPMRVPLQSPIRQLRVDRIDDRWVDAASDTQMKDDSVHWRIWLTANGDFTLGTFLQLCDNGTVNRVTWHEDGTESVFEVTDND